MHSDLHVLDFHYAYLKTVTQNWREYLDYISGELLTLVSAVPRLTLCFFIWSSQGMD